MTAPRYGFDCGTGELEVREHTADELAELEQARAEVVVAGATSDPLAELVADAAAAAVAAVLPTLAPHADTAEVAHVARAAALDAARRDRLESDGMTGDDNGQT